MRGWAVSAETSDRARGLYGKYSVVRRADGADEPGGKHDGCALFVLDLTHDPHARVAALSYADSAEADGYGRLADDLRERVADAANAALIAADESTPRTPTDGRGGR